LRLHEIIDEIKGLNSQANHRSVNTILNFLVAFKEPLTRHIQIEELEALIKRFEAMSELRPIEFKSPSFENDYQRAFGILVFYLERIN